MNGEPTHIEFFVGAEKRLAEIITSAEMEPLLCSLIKAGPVYAGVMDEDHLPLCCQGAAEPHDTVTVSSHPLLVEGEPKGCLVVFCPAAAGEQYAPLGLLVRDALQLIINNNLKRMLTTEVHTAVVRESYDRLVETNRQLSESEQSYRRLALSLEQQVDERTAELKKAYSRMLQQEKLAAVGGLAAGMAHEINNPNGFIRSNLVTSGRYFLKTKEMLAYYRSRIAADTPLTQLLPESEAKWRELKLDTIFADTEDLLSQSLEGSDRIARIIADLKSFSHVDETGETDADLNRELERTMAVLTPQLPPGAVFVPNLQPLPLFGCNPGRLSQAFFNIIHNSLQSGTEGLEIHVSTELRDHDIMICVADNGCGISPDHLSRIFEPFFTTRAVGSGTGMGLTVAREIVTAAGGAVDVLSRAGRGTSITVRLPTGMKS